MVHVPTNRITTHPGALLLEQIREMGLSVNGVARDIHLPASAGMNRRRGWGVTRRAGAKRRTAQPLTRPDCGGYPSFSVVRPDFQQARRSLYLYVATCS